jgi:hypothetical protein
MGAQVLISETWYKASAPIFPFAIASRHIFSAGKLEDRTRRMRDRDVADSASVQKSSLFSAYKKPRRFISISYAEASML